MSHHLGGGCGSAISIFSYNCSFRSQEESNTGQDPVLLVSVLTLHSDIEQSYQVSSTSVCGEVNGAVITSDGGSFRLADGSNVNYWNFGGKFLQYHLIEVSLLTVTAIFPTSSFECESIDVSATFGELGNVSGVETVSNVSPQVHFIERLVGSTSSNLHNGGKERHGVEKSRNPKYIGGNELVRPALKLCASQDKIFKPDEKTLFGEIGNRLPAWRNGVHGKGPGELSHNFSDVQSTFETSIEVSKRAFHHVKESVHSLALLDTDDNERRSFRSLGVQVKHLELLRHFSLEFVNQLDDLAVTIAATTR